MDISEIIIVNVKEIIKSKWDLDVKDVFVEHPDNIGHGDFSTNISMKLAGQLKMPPLNIAEEIVHEMLDREPTFIFEDTPYPVFSQISAVSPGFINFTISDEWLKAELVKILILDTSYGASNLGNNEKIIVEFSQMNTNKPQHIGHARNNFLGSSISNILRFVGYDVIRSIYAGDIGAHAAKSILMYQLYGNSVEPTKKSDHFVGDFYVMYEDKLAENPALDEQAKEVLRKWENNDPEIRSIWEKMNNWVYEGWKKTYEDQELTYDLMERESDHIKIGKEIAEVAVSKNIAKRDESGAIIAELERFGLPDKVLLRNDGTSLYITKDLQLAKDSYEKYHFAKRFYVVDYRQSDYFKQVFKVLEILGFDWYDKLHHIAYGMVTLPEGSMSSRKGTIITADEVFEKLVTLEEEEIAKSSRNIRHKEETIKHVALSAFKYAMLKVDASQNITFNYDLATKFEGNTGPYILYTYARANSVLEKGGYSVGHNGVSSIEDFHGVSLVVEELALLRELYKFPEMVAKAASSAEPHIITNYIFEVASKFNSFYANCPVLDIEDSYVKKLRVSITAATAIVIRQALSLLGIPVVEKM